MSYHDEDNQTFHCPHCDAVVKVGARVCRSCGATEDCGWNEEGDWDTDLDDEFDYDEFVAREFPDQLDPESRNTGNRSWLPIVILALIATILFGFVLM